MERALVKIRKFLYSQGIRPQVGSIFHSPSLALQHMMRDSNFREALHIGIKSAQSYSGPLTPPVDTDDFMPELDKFKKEQ